uniref:Thylakoid lumenal 16. protein, chloroplastic n=1 Tax=Anthurium amnicola TaxID=1678845 RepID=A0A1D1YCM6_9ARAE
MAAMLGLHMATTPLNGFPPTATSQMAAGARPAGPPQTPRHRPISLNSAGNRTTVPGRTAARIPAASATNGGDGIAVDAPFSPSPLLPIPMGRRGCLAASAGLLASLSLTAGAAPARAAVLEADDDVELLEKVKQDRKKRLERQGVISSSGRETGYLQALVYTLSKVGQAIDNNDLSAAGTILGANANSEWLQNGNAAFAKVCFCRRLLSEQIGLEGCLGKG